MGREIRRVPPNWEHPMTEKYGRLRPQPMFDKTFKEAADEWKQGFLEWEKGKRPDYCSEENQDLEFWEYEGGPPDREYYRPWNNEEATWYQVWETVSEGTPVTPPFATEQELIDYLVENGDFWYQRDIKEKGYSRYRSKPTKEEAECFVRGGWAPSLLIVNQPGQPAQVKTNYQIMEGGE